jgi:hypothetical protein
MTGDVMKQREHLKRAIDLPAAFAIVVSSYYTSKRQQL